eukprot:COSAG02_NODE_10623_length_1898_cov_1.339077_1_plen_446_part_00
MYTTIFAWADEDEDGLVSMEEFVRLQTNCDNETPSVSQWEQMCGALHCLAADGLTESALVKLYEGEGPHGDYYTLLEKELIEDPGGAERAAKREAQLLKKLLAAGGGAGEEAETTDRGESRLLDAQFDALAQEYDDDDIGALGDSADEATRGRLDVAAFGDLLDEFIADEEDVKGIAANVIGNSKEKTDDDYADLDNKSHVLARYGPDAPELPPAADLEDKKSLRDDMGDWDAESIVTTYSNTENHPGLISYKGSKSGRGRKGRRKKVQAEGGEEEAAAGANGGANEAAEPEPEPEPQLPPLVQGDIRLSAKSGLPVGYYSLNAIRENAARIVEGDEAAEAAALGQEEEEVGGGDDDGEYDDEYDSEEDYDDELPPENKGAARPRHGKESKAEKKARKAAVKAERAMNRKMKKGMKLAYRKEELAQEKSMNLGSALHGRTVLSIS